MGVLIWAGRGLGVTVSISPMISLCFGPNVYISGTFSVYLWPNVYIYVQMSILMSNGGGFLWVIRVLQTVGTQIRAVGARKWSGWSNFSIISVI